jgi:hypothetical protein
MSKKDDNQFDKFYLYFYNNVLALSKIRTIVSNERTTIIDLQFIMNREIIS